MITLAPVFALLLTGGALLLSCCLKMSTLGGIPRDDEDVDCLLYLHLVPLSGGKRHVLVVVVLYLS